MKSIFSIIILITVFNAYAQEQISSYQGTLSQTVDISDYENKKFRLSAYLRAHKNNTKSALLYIYARTNDSDNKLVDFFVDKNAKNLIVDKKWTKTIINGSFNTGVKTLKIGAACLYNGTFYYDNFKLEIQDRKGNWKSIKILNPGFEEKLDSTGLIWNNDKINKIREFSAKLSSNNPYQGEKCLSITGQNVVGKNETNGKYIAVNNVKLYYEVYGSGEPLILLHGAGGSITSFMNQIHFFSRKYKVIAVDSRGRGNSTDNTETLTYVNQAKDMNLFMEKLGIKSAHILGWSDGGIIGLILAKDYPDRVLKLVAMGANINPEGLFDDRLKMHKENLAKLEKKEDYDPQSIRVKVYKLLINYPQMEYKDLNSIVSPSLIMAGDHDVIKDIHTVKIYQSIPNANLAILPGETHWLPEMNAKLFNEIVLNFLSKEFKEPKRY